MRGIGGRMLPSALFAALILLVYADPLFVRRNFAGRDLLAYHLPIEKQVHDAYARGTASRLVLRDLRRTPAARRTRTSGALYPLRALLAPLSFPAAIRIFPIVHWIGAGARDPGAPLGPRRVRPRGLDRRGHLRLFGRLRLRGLLHELRAGHDAAALDRLGDAPLPRGARRPAPRDPLRARPARGRRLHDRTRDRRGASLDSPRDAGSGAPPPRRPHRRRVRSRASARGAADRRERALGSAHPPGGRRNEAARGARVFAVAVAAARARDPVSVRRHVVPRSVRDLGPPGVSQLLREPVRGSARRRRRRRAPVVPRARRPLRPVVPRRLHPVLHAPWTRPELLGGRAIASASALPGEDGGRHRLRARPPGGARARPPALRRPPAPLDPRRGRRRWRR